MMSKFGKQTLFDFWLHSFNPVEFVNTCCLIISILSVLYSPRNNQILISCSVFWAQIVCRSLSIFKSITNLTSEILFFFLSGGRYTKVKRSSLLYYLLTAGLKIVGFLPFLSVLVLCEMQIAPSRIWTRFAKSISKNNSCDATSTSLI